MRRAALCGYLIAASLAVVFPAPATAAFPGENGPVVYVSYRNGQADLYVLEAGAERQLTSYAGQEDHPAVSPEGTKVMFRRDFDELWVIDLDGTDAHAVTSTTQDEAMPAWSPDGTRIAYSRQETSGSVPDIWVADADGTDSVNLTGSADAWDVSPDWSPDGTRITWARSPSGSNGDIWVMEADGDAPVRLTTPELTGTSDDGSPGWSPDSTRIVFRSTLGSPNGDAYTIAADGTDLRKVTNRNNLDQPRYSPDGTRLVFGEITAPYDLYTVGLDGTGTTKAVDHPAVELSPVWAAVGSRPEVTGTAKEGETLTTTNGVFAGFAPTSHTYGWERCNADATGCAAIGGAEAASYQLGGGDVGKRVRSVVTGHRGAETRTHRSDPGPVVQAAAAANSPPPSQTGAPRNGQPRILYGTLAVGQTLTGDEGPWDGERPLAFTYQWLRCALPFCDEIPGATGRHYVLRPEDAGRQMLLWVTASNRLGRLTASTPVTPLVGGSTIATRPPVPPPSNPVPPTQLPPGPIGTVAPGGLGTPCNPLEASDWALGTSGPDTLAGIPARDCYHGLEGNDRIFGLGGDDFLDGNAGADVIDGGDGHDHATAGAGDDLLVGNLGNDDLFGEDGADNIGGSQGGDTLGGGGGNDVLVDTSSERDNLFGHEGNDIINAVSGAFDVIDCGAGNDTAHVDSHDYAISCEKTLSGPGPSGPTVPPAGGGGGGGGPGPGGGPEGGRGDNTDEDAPGGQVGGGTGGGRPRPVEPDDVPQPPACDVGRKVGTLGADVLNGTVGIDDIAARAGNDRVFGSGGNDCIYGERDDDTLEGGDGNDVISGADDVDRVYGNAGADFLMGDDIDANHAWADTIDGGKGNDVVYGWIGPDVVGGGDGDDDVVGGGGDDTAGGNDDDDAVYTGSGDDAAIGGTGVDLLVGSVGNDWLDAGDGRPNDSADCGPGFDVALLDYGDIYQGDCNIRVLVAVIGAGACRVIRVGGAAADTINGTAADEAIFGEGNSDTLNGYGGKDCLHAGFGLDPDTLRGGDGNDVLIGVRGHDRLFGDSGNDIVEPGVGNDYVEAGSGDDLVYGWEGDDVIKGAAGADTLYGAWGKDDLDGGDGNDQLQGFDGDDIIRGGTGADLINAGDGDDRIDDRSPGTYVVTGAGKDNVNVLNNGKDTVVCDAVAAMLDAHDSRIQIANPDYVFADWYDETIGCGQVQYGGAPPPKPPVPDRDSDGVPDVTDQCPSAKGPKATKGCPDGDVDGTADTFDDCPKVKGPAKTNGCPDGDGDMVIDSQDACPKVPGDPPTGCKTGPPPCKTPWAGTVSGSFGGFKLMERTGGVKSPITLKITAGGSVSGTLPVGSVACKGEKVDEMITVEVARKPADPKASSGWETKGKLSLTQGQWTPLNAFTRTGPQFGLTFKLDAGLKSISLKFFEAKFGLGYNSLYGKLAANVALALSGSTTWKDVGTYLARTRNIDPRIAALGVSYQVVEDTKAVRTAYDLTLNVNQVTEFMLDLFDITPPEFLTDAIRELGDLLTFGEAPEGREAVERLGRDPYLPAGEARAARAARRHVPARAARSRPLGLRRDLHVSPVTDRLFERGRWRIVPPAQRRAAVREALGLPQDVSVRPGWLFTSAARTRPGGRVEVMAAGLRHPEEVIVTLVGRRHASQARLGVSEGFAGASVRLPRRLRAGRYTLAVVDLSTATRATPGLVALAPIDVAGKRRRG